MPVSVTVSQVRKAIEHASRFAEGQAGSGAHSSTALLGQLFHEIFALMVQPDSKLGFATLLASANATLSDWRDALKDSIYRDYVRERLDHHQAVLHEYAAETDAFWKAVDNLTDWLAEVLWAVRKPDGALPNAASLVVAEQAVRVEVRDPGWTDAVVLTGQIDALWNAPNGKGWCVAEFKLGKTNPPADLAQTCLYHWMLEELTKPRDPTSGLTLLSFAPERSERFFDANNLAPAKRRLLDLIGSIAGVIPPRPPCIAIPDDSAKGSLPPHAGAIKSDDEDAARGKELATELLRVLAEFDAPAELAEEPILGPSFHRIVVWQGRGVRVNKFLNLGKDIQSRLRLPAPPIIELTEGRIAVDVARERRRFFRFEEIVDRLPRDPVFGFTNLIVGVDASNRLCLADLCEPDNCHFLVAGTPGSGKSEWLRTAALGLIALNRPEAVRVVFIDPKRSAFNDLAGCPHLFEPIVYPDETDPVGVLQRLTDEVDERYRIMNGASSLGVHYDRTGKLLPRIVLFCDEYFDLIARDKATRKAVETPLARLCSKGRAAGVHLVIATQRPDRETIKGVLDSNLPARVALRVVKEAEARMIGCAGAERLLGKGDLLFKSGGIQTLRLQGVYASPETARSALANVDRASVSAAAGAQ